MAAPSGGYLSPGRAGPCGGLEVDQRATGLQVAPLAQGIEATPAELQSGYAPQMIPGPEKKRLLSWKGRPLCSVMTIPTSRALPGLPYFPIERNPGSSWQQSLVLL